jgi:prepilin-type processing-associated H-X9-DG protein
MGILFLLGVLVWVGMSISGEKRRTWLCAHHMKVLGRAFAEYTEAHSQKLPVGVYDDGSGNSTSWDKEIAVYLEPELVEKNTSERQKALEAKVAPFFKCPSDSEPRGGAASRSYAMPLYDLNKIGWPPDKNVSGGLGLYLDAKAIARARAEAPVSPANDVPAITLSMVSAPADTALLVERISILNALWQAKYACIATPGEQFDAKTIDAKNFHGGNMNYLMLDGHVELLSPEMISSVPPSIWKGGGIWTIRPED